MTRLLQLAHKLAPRGKHRMPGLRMAAIVFRGGAIVSVGVNLGVNARRHHAEQRALKPHRDYVGAKMVIARENGGISKPCPECMDKLRRAGIAEVTYVDRERRTVTERVHNAPRPYLV